MQSNATTEADRPPAVAPTIRHTVPWRVNALSPLADFCLRVTFVDGTSGEVDMRAFLHTAEIHDTVFAPLRDPGVFAQVRIELGAVQWPNGADLAPDTMYDEIKAHGRWVLT